MRGVRSGSASVVEELVVMSQAPTSTTNRLLGYPDDARLLLVNADDFGMYQSINEAVYRNAGRSRVTLAPLLGAHRVGFTASKAF